MKIFVVEDNPIDLKLVRVVLQVEGHDVREETCADGVIDLIRSYRPDVILLDLNLPDADGIDVIRALRACADTCAIPVLAVTAYPQRYPRPDLLAAGFTGFILKPIDTRELDGQLQSIVGRATGEPI